MNSLALTEKQQEVLWLRYGRRASINQIAAWLKITRRAVLARLRNARRRTAQAGRVFPELKESLSAEQRIRPVSGSAISSKHTSLGSELDEL